MKILSIGEHITHKKVSNAEFRSPVSFFDFDVVILNPSTIFSEYEIDILSPTYMGCKVLRESESQKIVNDFSRRRSEIAELIKLGRAVILILPGPEKCYYPTGQTTYTGSGKSKVANKTVSELDLFSFVPLKDLATVEARGKSIEFRGAEPFKTYWDKTKDYHYYSSYLSSPLGKPFLFIKGTAKAVATWIPTDQGIFLIIPFFYGLDSYKTQKDYTGFWSLFLDAITNLISELNKSTGDYSLPAWTTTCFLPGEKDRGEELKSKEVQLEALISQISQSKDRLAKTEKYKLLLGGTGRALEVQVAAVLKEIGFSVEPGAEGRDDLILKYGEKVAVAEVKGVSKSASEKHAAQLEKWVAEYISLNEAKPKGILIVNAYCNTPLQGRSDPAFPNQMISYSRNREHCLITTTQLLGVYLSVISKPESRDHLINELFATNGVYEKFLDYREFLEVEEPNIEG